jgi:hypothetical protein
MHGTNLYFDTLLLACCGYAWWRGAPPERIAASAFFIGVALTRLAYAPWSRAWSSVETGVFTVDLLLLLTLIALALVAERFWILWLTAFHLIGTTGHLVKLADPSLIRWGYAFVIAAPGYPMCLLIALGTWRHRQRLIRIGADRSWSSFSVPSGHKRVAGRTT